MLLYLSKNTWVGEVGKKLQDEVHLAMECDLPIHMVHENDESKDGCDFAHFFLTTPTSLIEAGLYQKLALAWIAPPFRLISVKLSLKKQLGAVTTSVTRRNTSLGSLMSRRSSGSVRSIKSTSRSNKGCGSTSRSIEAEPEGSIGRSSTA
jgi:hypothetical protein